MISVLIFVESRFPIDRMKVRDFVQKYLDKKLKGNAEVGISIVGDRKMKSLNTNYRNKPQSTDVLSFPLDDPSVPNSLDIKVGFSPERSSPDKVLRLGDVIVSYPQAVLEAADENKFVNQKVEELIAHGLDHLMGIHHD